MSRMVEELVNSAMKHVIVLESGRLGLDTVADVERVRGEAESVAMQSLEAIHGIGAALHAGGCSDARPIDEYAADLGTAICLLSELMNKAMELERAADLALYEPPKIKAV